MNIYLASRYSRRLELCRYRDQLQALGFRVTSRWLNGEHQISDSGQPIGEHGERLVEGDDGSMSEVAAILRLSFAREDVADVLQSNIVINFTEPPRSNASRGGRHVEFGLALGLNLQAARYGLGWRTRLVVIGYRENLFHWLPEVEFFPTWEACLKSLSGECHDDHGNGD